MSKRSKCGARICASRSANPVAKHARKFNKAVAFRDRTRYARNPKHRGLEPFPLHICSLAGALGKVSGTSMGGCR